MRKRGVCRILIARLLGSSSSLLMWRLCVSEHPRRHRTGQTLGVEQAGAQGLGRGDEWFTPSARPQYLVCDRLGGGAEGGAVGPHGLHRAI